MIVIANNPIHVIDSLYSLNDLHQVSGGHKKHQPSNWLRLNQAQEIIAELKDEAYRTSDMRNLEPVKVIKGIQADGTPQGTYACKELVYSYAMWISPRFHLMVIRAFDVMAKNSNILSIKLNFLCRELNTLELGLSNAGRFLSIAGKQTKPKLRKAINQTLEQMQPQLPLEPTDSLTCQQVTTYLDQDNKLNHLDDELLNGDLGDGNDE